MMLRHVLFCCCKLTWTCRCTKRAARRASCCRRLVSSSRTSTASTLFCAPPMARSSDKKSYYTPPSESCTRHAHTIRRATRAHRCAPKRINTTIDSCPRRISCRSSSIRRAHFSPIVTRSRASTIRSSSSTNTTSNGSTRISRASLNASSTWTK